MRIYYFGELIEDTSNPKIKEQRQKQTSLQLEEPQAQQTRQKTVMERVVDDLLQDIDMNLEAKLPFRFGTATEAVQS